MTNYIGIDTSKTSTGLCIEVHNKITLFNYTNHKSNYKWIKNTEHLIQFRFFNYVEVDDYSLNEYQRLKVYADISNQLIKDILDNINPDYKTIIGIEGYNYGGSVGNIIDCVSIGSMIRIKILENIPKCEIRIIAPKQVKTLICERIYGIPMQLLGKKGQPLKEKVVSKNDLGVAGGNFEKGDMLKAIIDGNIQSPILDYCKEHLIEISNGVSVKKPFEDVNDAVIIKEILK